MRRLGLPAAVLAVVGLIAAACGGGDDAAAESADRLATYRREGVVIGIAPEPPYGYEEDGEATGAAPELAREILSRLDIEIRDYIETDFGFLIDGLAAERLDIISAGIFITPERAQDVLFADPDYCASTAFAVPAGNPHNLVDYGSAVDAGITLGVVVGSVEQDAAPRSGVTNVEEFPTNDEAFAALESGEVHAVALTTHTVAYETDQMQGFEATEGFVPVIDGEEQIGCGAFGFRYEDQALRDAFNHELKEMQEAGEVLPIVEPFGFDQDAVDTAATRTASELAEDG